MVTQYRQQGTPAPLSKEEIDRQMSMLDKFIPAAQAQRISPQAIREFVNNYFAPEAANQWINTTVYDWDVMNNLLNKDGGERARAVKSYMGAWRNEGYRPTNAIRTMRLGVGPLSFEHQRAENRPDLTGGFTAGAGAMGANNLLAGGAGLISPINPLPAGQLGPLAPGQAAAATGRFAGIRNAVASGLPGGMVAAPLAGVGLGMAIAPSVTNVWDRIFGDPRFQ